MIDPFADSSGQPKKDLDPFADLAATEKVDPFAVEGTKKSRKPSITKLQSEVAELEAKAAEHGVEEYGPGLMGWLQYAVSNPLSSGLIDILSRGNYAVAGAFEEKARTGSTQAAVVRAAREVLSGIGGIEGEKRAFGEVLERAGVPEMGRVSQLGILPSEQTARSLAAGLGAVGRPVEAAIAGLSSEGGPLDVTGRGALGLVLDIVADPTTYLTAGAGKGVQILARGAPKVLSRAGAKVYGKELAAAIPEVLRAGERIPLSHLPQWGQEAAETAALGIARETVGEAFAVPKTAPLLKRRASAQMLDRAMAESPAMQDAIDSEMRTLLASGIKKGEPFYERYQREVVAKAQERVAEAAESTPNLLNRGGIKWMGLTIPGTPGAAAFMSSKIIRAMEGLEGVPIVGRAVKQANDRYDLAGRMVADRDWNLRHHPEDVLVKQVHLDAQAALLAKTLRAIEQSEAFQWLRKQGKNEPLWGKLTRAAETGDTKGLTAMESRVVSDERQLMDDMALLEMEIGELKGVRPNYIAHFYDNTDIQMKQIFTGQPVVVFRGKSYDLASLGQHAEERVFDTLDDAAEVAAELTKGQRKPPVLKPIYNPIERMVRRSQAHAQTITMSSYYDLLAKTRGKTMTAPLDDIIRQTEIPKDLSAKMIEEIDEVVGKGATPKEYVAALSPAGKTYFMRQRLIKVTNHEELSNVIGKYGDIIPDLERVNTAARPLDADGLPMMSTNIERIKDVYLPQHIALDLADMGERIFKSKDLDEMFRGWDALTNFTKSYLTVPFPAFHIRNAYSNVAQMFLDTGISTLDPRIARHTAGVMMGAEGTFGTKVGTEYGYKELHELAEQYGVIATAADIGELTGKIKAFERGPIRAARQVGTGIENLARFQHWLNRIRRGDDPLLAAQRVKEVLFDYKNLTRTEKDVLRRLIPFYTFSRKNIALQLRKFGTRPGLMAAEVKPFRGREEENRGMISWEGRALKLRLNRDGKTLRVLSGIDIPIRNVDNLWAGSLGATAARQLGMLNPILKVYPEISSQRSLFTGRDMTRQESAALGRILEHAPEFTRNYLGYKKVVDEAGRPTYTFNGERFYLLFQSWAVSRLVSTTDRQFKTLASDPNAAAVFLDIITGLRDKTIDMDEQQMRMLKERKAYLERQLEGAGVLKRGTYTYEPKP